MSLLALILATFVSEDLTCITAGLLLSRHQIDLWTALGGCYIGVLAGDFGLWLVGRWLGTTVLTWPRVRRLLPVGTEELGRWFDRHSAKVVFAARFVPGTRYPTYLAAGALGRGAGRFLMVAALAGLLWTPLLIGIVAKFGEPVVHPLEQILESGWIAAIVAAVLLFAALAAVRVACTRSLDRYAAHRRAMAAGDSSPVRTPEARRRPPARVKSSLGLED